MLFSEIYSCQGHRIHTVESYECVKERQTSFLLSQKMPRSSHFSCGVRSRKGHRANDNLIGMKCNEGFHRNALFSTTLLTDPKVIRNMALKSRSARSRSQWIESWLGIANTETLIEQFLGPSPKADWWSLEYADIFQPIGQKTGKKIVHSLIVNHVP